MGIVFGGEKGQRVRDFGGVVILMKYINTFVSGECLCLQLFSMYISSCHMGIVNWSYNIA